MKTLAEELASKHHEYGVYDGIELFKTLRENANTNILKFYDSLDGLKSFTKFSNEYFRHYDTLPEKTFNNINQVNTKQARGVDFPFIGDEVIKSGKAKFMFVFEGSLSKNNEDIKIGESEVQSDFKSDYKNKAKLSLTVLANLWHIDVEDEIKVQFKKQELGKAVFWKYANFYNVKSQLQLNLNQDVINNCFVTDAIRLAKVDDPTKRDVKKNRELIWEEINILKPDLVICVGNTAKETVGMNYSELNTKFHHIPFPTFRKSKDKNSNDEVLYSNLSEIYQKILKLES